MRTGNVAASKLQETAQRCSDRSRPILLLNSTRGEAGRVLLIEKDKMKSAPSNRSTAAWKPLALVSALATLSFPAVAQVESGQQLAPVTVSASRFSSDITPIGATVITAEEIREAGINNVNEAIRKIGGVYGRQNLSGTSDFALDLRGFGSTGDNNMVVMVDGIRISENEQVPALMSSIPIESVERIEIVRGGSSVLYGEGATGGTIQIITKRGATIGTHGSIVAEIGNYNHKEMRASLTKGWDNFSIDANLSTLHSDNYRYNSKVRQDNFSGGFQWASAEGRVGVRVEAGRQDSGFPGSLTLAQYLQNPRQASSLVNSGSLDSDRYTIFAERRLGNWELAADLSYRDRTAKFDSPPGAQFIYDGQATQFSPRARHTSRIGSVKNELVVGMDFSNASRREMMDGSPSVDTGSQKSQAIYARDEIRFGKTRIAVGARHEKFEKKFRGTFNSSDQDFSLNAWDLQASYDLLSTLNIFAKAGESYRVANLDDNSGKQSNQLLNPQRSNDLEFGAAFSNDGKKLTAKVFRHKLKDEIYLDPTVLTFGFATNVNLDPTQRQGMEIEASTRLTQAFTASAILRHVSAKIIDGPNAGREMTLVPKNTATLRLNWLPGNGQSADVGVQWVSSQRYGSDFDNTCGALMPSFATLDGRYAMRVGAWEFAVTGSNLTDKNYYSQAYQCKAGIYPSAGRAVKLSARMDF